MDNAALKRIIVDQREEIDQLLHGEKIVTRELNILPSLSHPNAVMITGPRRVGKSFLSFLTLGGRSFGYLNFDDERIALSGENLNQVLECFYELYGDLDTLVLDEIQNIEGWELFVSRLRRTKRVIVTGSNSKLLSRELATRLTGRHLDHTLLPFSFREHLQMKGIPFAAGATESTRRTAALKEELGIYLRNGGFPEVHKFGKAILKTMYDDIIQKDIILRHKIRKTAEFKDMARYLFSIFGREFTYSRLRNVIRISDIHTVKKFVDYMASAYLLFVIERFSFKLKQHIIAPKKIYGFDSGLIRAISFQVSENQGALYENTVAVELLRQKFYANSDLEIYYWKNVRQQEVDFVVKSGKKVRQLIQSSYSLGDFQTREREIRALLKAADELHCQDLMIITADEEKTEKHGGYAIKIIPLWKWLLHPLL
ncbi:MAG: ATP-binding protein [Candidatus Aminicenantes bacterium]|nr:ATP-binding protein [Candidatus Aminicenantes bacterium]